MLLLQQGGYKLKIPTMLLSEKERTRNRFSRTQTQEEGSHRDCSEQTHTTTIIEEEADLLLQPDQESTHEKKTKQKKEGKKRKRHDQMMQASKEDDQSLDDQIAKALSSSPVLAQKICNAVQEDILPLAEEAQKNLLPPFTPFHMTEADNIQHIVHLMKRECPSLCDKDNRENFLVMILEMLET